MDGLISLIACVGTFNKELLGPKFVAKHEESPKNAWQTPRLWCMISA